MYVDVRMIYANHVSSTKRFLEDLRRLRAGQPVALTLIVLLVVERSLSSTGVVSNVSQYWNR